MSDGNPLFDKTGPETTRQDSEAAEVGGLFYWGLLLSKNASGALSEIYLLRGHSLWAAVAIQKWSWVSERDLFRVGHYTFWGGLLLFKMVLGAAKSALDVL